MGIYWFHIIPTNWIGSFAHPSHSFARNKNNQPSGKRLFFNGLPQIDHANETSKEL
jgi:hypothetical protein